jgi:hypothetical protein
MESILKLNIQSENEKAEAARLQSQGREEPQPQPQAPSKRFNKFAKSTAHKAASHSSRGGSGIFTK